MRRGEPLSTPDTKRGVLERAVLDSIRVHESQPDGLPTSIRFLFYELEQAGIVSKVRAERTDGKVGQRPDQDVQEAVTRLRERGLIPWDWIVDETRTLLAWRDAPSVAQYLIDTADLARINPWAFTRRPLILCESRTFGGVLTRTLGPDYHPAVAATNGQARGFLVTKVAPEIARAGLRVLYVGDADDAGDDIEGNTRAVLEREGCDFGDGGWERVALTERQVSDLRRRGVSPVMKSDKRRPGLRPCWEVEALGQSRVVGMLRRRLDTLLPEPLAAVLERERRQRAKARKTLAKP